MNIKQRGTDYLITPETLLTLTGVVSEKYGIADMHKSTLDISELTEDMLSETWATIEADARKLKKLKKSLITGFGNTKLEDYKNTDLIERTLSKKFINTSAIADVLRNSLKNDMNLVVFGRGGYGKSEMISELFSGPEFKDRVFIKSLSAATTEEDLFGGVDIKKVMDTGIQEFICENSFANKEIVIFEEIFDANPKVLAALKDAITSKEIRNGNQRFALKTKIIIGLTNKTYEEVIMDDSTEALTQRFPVSFKLEYDLTETDVAALTLMRYPTIEPKKLMGILEWAAKISKDKLTPRKVIETAKYLHGININPEKSYKEMITNNSVTSAIEYVQNVKRFSPGMPKLRLETELMKIEGRISRKEMTDYDHIADANLKSRLIKNILSHDIYKELDKLIATPDEKTIAKLETLCECITEMPVKKGMLEEIEKMEAIMTTGSKTSGMKMLETCKMSA